MTKTLKTSAAAALLLGSMTALSACYSTPTDDVKLTKNDTHFPVRMVSDLDMSKIETFRADTIIENNCLYAVKVGGKAPSKKYVLTWPTGSVMEFNGRKLVVASAAADSGVQDRFVGEVGKRMQFTGVLKNETYQYRRGYHKGTPERDCGNASIARVATWKTIG